MATRTVLLGRDRECDVLDRLLAAVSAGESRTLVVRGDPGMGKSALLDHLVERASECRVVRAAGVQSEMELVFAGLHQLCGPLFDGLDRLPGPQRDALGTAFGLSEGPMPDRFLVGLAVLSLFSESTEERPLVGIVDDAQWLDRASAQVLAFVGRRLEAEAVALVFAVRELGDESDLAGLPTLAVEGLAGRDAHALLRVAMQVPLDERIIDRIVAETRGNPLALLELPRGMTRAELAGGFGLPDALPLATRIEESFRRRVEALPAETQRLLLVAAAEPVGAPALLWPAAERLGIGFGAAAPAEADGLFKTGTRVMFQHPLVRSAVYRAASLADRQQVHAALAEVTDPDLDPDRRAWHRAQATRGPDEDVAAELERSAGRAQARGGLAAAAAFLERAAALTPESGPRAARALAAAAAQCQAGAHNAALALLVTAEAGPLDKLQWAQLDLVRAQIAFASDRGRDAPLLLLKAAKQLELLDIDLARETYLDALSAAEFAGWLASGGTLLEVAEAALSLIPTSLPLRAPDLLLESLAVLFTDGFAAGAPMVKRTLSVFRRGEISKEEGLRWLWLASITAAAMWDDETWEVLATRHVQLAREAGALAVLPLALSSRIAVHMFAGELALAASLVEEMAAATDATGSRIAPYGALLLAAARGREGDAIELIEATVDEVLTRGEGAGVIVLKWATAALYNGLGRHEDAQVAAHQACEHPDQLNASIKWALCELIEAAARNGRPEEAADALARLSVMARASGTDWALGIEARSRALLDNGDTAEALYQEAIERLGNTRVRVELARAHLVYGEWLRRENRRLDGRLHLRSAHEMFATMGAEAFAERAARELLAAGETARQPAVETLNALTAQESQIAGLARDAQTNAEIGAQLFISARTVEWHLHKVFAKLGITSRRELSRALPDDRRTAPLRG